MQHDLDFDRAWDKVSKRFWRRRWRELVIHTVLFVIGNFYIFLNPQVAPTFTTGYGPLIVLRQLGFENFPWATLNWGFVLAIHIFIIISLGLGERIFRYGVERELLRDFARSNQMDEKRKNRPAYHNLSDEETSFEYAEDGETTYNQSAR